MISDRWLPVPRGVGSERAADCSFRAEGRGFESRFPLQYAMTPEARPFGRASALACARSILPSPVGRQNLIRVCGVLARLIRPASDLERVPLPRRQGVRDPLPRSQMLCRTCRVATLSYPGLATCLGSARPHRTLGLETPTGSPVRASPPRAGWITARPVLGACLFNLRLDRVIIWA